MFNVLGIRKKLTSFMHSPTAEAGAEAGLAAIAAATAAQGQGGIRKPGYDGRPAKSGTAPVVVDNGLTYISG